MSCPLSAEWHPLSGPSINSQAKEQLLYFSLYTALIWITTASTGWIRSIEHRAGLGCDEAFTPFVSQLFYILVEVHSSIIPRPDMEQTLIGVGHARAGRRGRRRERTHPLPPSRPLAVAFPRTFLPFASPSASSCPLNLPSYYPITN